MAASVARQATHPVSIDQFRAKKESDTLDSLRGLLTRTSGDKFRDVKGALAAAVKPAGLKKVTWHMFRHTFASRLTRNGADIVTVKELLGHASISTTMRYAHSNDDAKRRAVAKLATSDKVVTVVPRKKKAGSMVYGIVTEIATH
jgi:integrase